MATLSDFVAMGPDAQVRVNGILYDATAGQWRDAGDKVDCSDTSDGSFGTARVHKKGKVGLGEFTMSVTATRQSDVSPHLPPLSISRGDIITLEFFPFGVSVGRVYMVPRFHIESTDGGFQVQGSQAQTIQFSGFSDGTFSLDGES